MNSERPKIPTESAEDLYENAPCGYLSTEPGGRIVRVNQTLLDMTGHDREVILGGMRFQELMTVPGRVFYDTHFAPLLRIRGFVKEIACDLVRPGRASLPVLVNAVQVNDEAGKPSIVRITIFDATERRRYETDILRAKKEAEHYAKIVRESVDAILSIGPDGSIEKWNKAAEQIFGETDGDAVGQKIWDLIKLANGTSPLQASLKTLNKGQVVHFEAVCVTKGGRKLVMNVTLTPHIEPPGEITSISAVLRDVTVQREAEKLERKHELQQNILAFQEAERQRISRDLHDHLGQQATGIRLGLEALKNAAPPGSEFGRMVAEIQEQAWQMDRDMSFLAFELRPKELSEMPLPVALNSYVRQWSNNYGIAAAFHNVAESSVKFGENVEANLYRIAQEALNNAAKHSKADSLNVILDLREQYALLIVEDDGVGFDLESLRTHNEDKSGGLGLVGMRERAALLGGTVEIETRFGSGTSIFVRVPLGEDTN